MLKIDGVIYDKILQGKTVAEAVKEDLDYVTLNYISDTIKGPDMYAPATLSLARSIIWEDVEHSLPMNLTTPGTDSLVTPQGAVAPVFRVLAENRFSRSLTLHIDRVSWTIYNNQAPNPETMTVEISFGDDMSPSRPDRILVWAEGALQHGGDNPPDTWLYFNSVEETITITLSEQDWDKYVYTPTIKNYIVASRELTLYGKYPTKSYNHTIVLIEPTKYLERVLLSPMSFTNKNDSLLDQVEKLLTKVSPILEQEALRFRLSLGLKSILEDVPGEDFYFSSPTTLRDALDEMLGVVSARVRVNKLDDIANVELDYLSYLPSDGLEAESVPNLAKDSMSQSVEYYAGNLEVYAENVEHSERQSIWHPSLEGWDTFKTNEATLTDQNAFIDTKYPIDYVTGFYINVRLNWTRTWMEDKEEQKDYGQIDVPLDISPWVVSDEEFAALPDKGNFSKENVMSYVRGESTFDLRAVRKLIFWKISNFEKVAKRAFGAANSDGPTRQSWVGRIMGYWEAPNTEFVFNNTTIRYVPEGTPIPIVLTARGFKWQEALVKMAYVPFIDTKFKVPKGDDMGSLLASTSMFDSQSDRTVELSRAVSQLRNKSMQIGEAEYITNSEIRSLEEILPLKTTLPADPITKESYILIGRSYSIFDNYIRVRYEWADRIKYIEDRLAIKREKTIYEIPLEYIKRDVFLEEAVIVSRDFKGYDSTCVLASSQYIHRLVRTIYGVPPFFWGASLDRIKERHPGVYDHHTTETYTSPNRLSNLLVQLKDKNDNIIGPYELPISLFAENNILQAAAHFLDNYSTGYSLEGRVLRRQKVIYNPYTDTEGEALKIAMESVYEDFHLDPLLFYADYNLDRAKDLPATDKTINPMYLFWRRLEKDAAEHISIIAQVSLEVDKADKGDIIIGDALIKENHAMPNFDRDSHLVVYTSTRKYKPNETKIAHGNPRTLKLKTGSYLPSVAEHNYIELEGSIGGYASWAIGDKDRNLYLAINDTSIKRIYFNAKRRR